MKLDYVKLKKMLFLFTYLVVFPHKDATDDNQKMVHYQKKTDNVFTDETNSHIQQPIK